MQHLLDIVRREPARVMGVVKALLVVAIAFGLGLTAEQREVLLGLAAAVLALAEGTRAMVTPTAKLPPPSAS